MGIEAAIVGGLLAAAGVSAAASAGAFGKPRSPDFPRPPRILGDDSSTAQAAAAAEKRRKQAAAAFGRGDTILTGPSGLVGEPDGQRKTLLGQ